MQVNDSNQNMRATLGRLELRCPPLPQTLVEATNLIEDPEQLELGPVTEMVQRDPIVVAKLLHIVNSAYYGLRRAITSAERTVVMLGPVAVAGIVVGMNMLKLNSILEGPASNCFNRLIRHSVATAFLLRHMLEGGPGRRARQNNSKRVGASFTAGLLHDFGKIILVYNYPKEAVELYEKQTLEEQFIDTDIRQLEQLLFGCDHTEAGEFVARKLGFPDMLTDIMRHHHEPLRFEGDAETGRMIRATAAANLAAKAMGYSIDKPLSWEAAAGYPIWAHLIDKDLPQYESPTALITDLQSQEEHLDDYVLALTSMPKPAPHKPAVRRVSYRH